MYEVKTLSANRVKGIRALLGLSQMALAELLNLKAWATVSRWENDNVMCTGPAVLILLKLEGEKTKMLESTDCEYCKESFSYDPMEEIVECPYCGEVFMIKDLEEAKNR